MLIDWPSKPLLRKGHVSEWTNSIPKPVQIGRFKSSTSCTLIKFQTNYTTSFHWRQDLFLAQATELTALGEILEGVQVKSSEVCCGKLSYITSNTPVKVGSSNSRVLSFTGSRGKACRAMGISNHKQTVPHYRHSKPLISSWWERFLHAANVEEQIQWQETNIYTRLEYRNTYFHSLF